MICTEDDEFSLRNFDREARWTCALSNGLTVFQDDNRYGQRDSAWLRLVEYCKENKVKVKKINIQFRSNIKSFENFEGVSLTKGAGGEIFSERTDNFIIVNILKNGEVHTAWWKCPEMLEERTYSTSVEEFLAGDFGETLIT